MIPQGLLVEDRTRQEFLLTTEPRPGMKTRRLVVLKDTAGQWKRLGGTQESAFRESLIGAFVDFFVDICRILNSPGSDQPSGADAPRRMTNRLPLRSSGRTKPRRR